MVPLELVLGEKQATLSLIWPATKPSFVVGAASKPAPAAEKPKPAPASKPAASAKPAAAPGAAAKTGSRPAARPGELPTYSQSLLRIKVPVVVTLAKKRQSLGRIVEIGPGSILQFDKSCEEMLELDVGSRPVATGEAVKVGDKFGLRVTSIVMPEERFKPVGTKG
ncbi:MAG: FliM/FliN family flagellar motor switch protein [Pirellulales bacterium]|nr:FliM/FliN family flagellar motor switch protein [Pirellulales bacterium]